MTETEKIAAVIVTAVKTATEPILKRCGTLEATVAALVARPSVPGPVGEKGERGETGPQGHDGIGLPGPAGRDGINGIDGKDAPAVDLEDLARRAAGLVPTPDHLSDDELTTLCDDLTRKTFGALPAPTRRMQKRIIRDHEGKIARVVEEPAAP